MTFPATPLHDSDGNVNVKAKSLLPALIISLHLKTVQVK